ncbi:MAG TPA: hypothetical protein VF503_10520 [Sphingobium sp.]|uniref:hypothetical protein n=1 Tax=Sphingobium sp. TaxID=1912891 RepID=UPI002ED1E781
MYYRAAAPFFALAALCAVPLAAMASMTNGAAPIRPSAAPMALDGHLLVETVSGRGEERRTLREAAEARSGDRLIFLIRYRNTGSTALTGYDFVSPIPRGVRILSDRADTVRVSADDGRSWVRPDSPSQADGHGEWRPAEDRTPTQIRVRLDRAIAPGETGAIAYRGLLL